MFRFTLRRKAPLLAFALGCVALLAPAGAQAQGCVDTHLRPTRENLDAVRQAVLCLHNRERGRHGLPALRENAKLRGAAAQHSGHMVDAHFFDHTSPGGGTMIDRIRQTGYMSSARGWSVGENIAWATGRLASAGEITDEWMRSSGHRANILRNQFREIGIGVEIGVPVRGSRSGATYTADFGFRR
ncbi:MAG TPA: CAP domain-containing protein [Solirubrobacteraceae bacterium]|nr:CAP domain-containing protein [Solirubrobacteraceae bacterium]